MNNQRQIPATRIEWTLLVIIYLLIMLFALTHVSNGQDTARSSEFIETVTEDTLSLSEQYLYRMAEKRKKGRSLGGGLSIGAGLFSLIGGAAMASNSDDNDFLQIDKTIGTALMATGVTSIVGGAVLLSIKSPTEKKRLEMLAYEDAGERDRAADKALHELAEKTRKRRLINSAIYGGLSVIALASGDENSKGAAAHTGMIAMLNLAIPSLEERQLKRYRKESGRQQPELKLGVGLTPRGGGVLRARIDF